MEPKIAAPQGVKNKKLWDKIEKSVIEYGKYKGARLYKVVSDAYQKAGGEYTHKSDKKSESAVEQMIRLGQKMHNKYAHQMPENLEFYTLDEVAETLPISNELSGHLWSLMPKNLPSQGEWPEPDSDDRKASSLQSKWHLLSPHQQEEIIKAYQIEYGENKTIEEKMEKQDRPTVPADKSEDEAKFYEDLLKMVKKKTEKKEAAFGHKDHYGFSHTIKKGDPVEFTRQLVQNYKMGDGEFGIAVEDQRPDRSVMVELADGSKYLARHIHAFAWSGWMPEELEPIWEKYHREGGEELENFDY